MATLRRQHEREIYMLKRKLHDSGSSKKSSINETTRSGSISSTSVTDHTEHLGSLCVSIPSFILSGVGSSSHVEYLVQIKTIGMCKSSVMGLILYGPNYWNLLIFSIGLNKHLKKNFLDNSRFPMECNETFSPIS